MDNVRVVLPCGFASQNSMPSLQNTRHNKTGMLKYGKLLSKEFEKYKNDPKYYIIESYDSLKREVDLRREEIKAIIIQKIDDYHDALLEKIDMERDLKLKELEERIQNTDSFDLVGFKIDKNLDIHSKLEFYTKNKIEIDNRISLVQNIIDDLNEPIFKLADFNDDINIEKIFGELYSNGETIQLIINNFSLLMDKKKLRINSKKFVFRNFEWFIGIILNQENEEMGFYLHCNSMEESNEFTVDITAELSLLNKSGSKKDLSRVSMSIHSLRMIEVGDILNLQP
ncbi:hypothetical protein BpHYR1_014630 [Brachionus plicatilis]|uniref:MATH domain-containing protein n=1 Tax=Brachionus plicatilis TaxID=10195 RepID=A0A3M7T7Z6_BRAPC|nr:hypothetical protein BpHYR1_014630 [Brachionus plicatilis]